MNLVEHNQSGLKETTIHFFFISVCPWNVLSRKTVWLAAYCICMCCNYYWAHHVWWLEIDLNKEPASERGEIRRFLNYTETKKRGGKAWPRREGSLSLFCMHGGFCGRRSWQGAAVLPPALRQQLLRKRRRPEGAATCLALSPALFSPVCLFLLPSRHTLDTCATQCVPYIHTQTSNPQWHTHTHTHRGREFGWFI